MEFNLGADTDGANGLKNGQTKSTGHKAAAGRDELVEMRFYIPGVIARKAEDEGEVDGNEEEEYDQQNAANHFYETLIEKAQIGEVAGDTFATFLDILHLTPRYVMVLARVSTMLTCGQRTLRYRYVRELVQITREDIRLQDSISIDQEILPSTQTRRDTYPDHTWIRSTSKTGPDQISIYRDAIEAR